MAEERLTAAQQAVVENDGGALLVSAAAGSGKTMVLVRRLLRMICDPQNPKNIDDFLIITYTKAAATELREKIARQISEKLAENPGNRHLARQLNRLYLAQISTVHSFCSTLLRTYAHTLDIPSDFRVAEQLETAALKQKILQKTLDTVYSELVADPAVKEFIETLGFGRDDRRVAKIVLSVYDSLRCHTDMEQWMHDSLQSVEIAEAEELSTASWVSALLQNCREVTLSLSRTMRGLASCCMEVPPFDTAYAPAMLADAKRLEELAEIDSWEQLSQIGKLSLSPIGKVPKQEDESFKNFLQQQRLSIRRRYQKLLEPFALGQQEARQELSTTGLALRGAFTVVRHFAAAYAQAKRRLHLMDYSDLEHEAVRLLVQKGTRLPTPLAKEISQRYAQIMVDEYQDTNDLQDRIFSAISKQETNLFMVGDVKQSIYRFRLADPTIFLEKYRTYQDYQGARDGEPRRILLSANFRSKPEILDAVNCVFRAVMTEQVGDLSYGDREALYDGRGQALSLKPPVELHCITAPEEDEDEETTDKPELEAEWIAQRIEQLLQTREAEPKDITILLRAAKGDGDYYATALKRRGIPVQTAGAVSILHTTELEALCNLLQVLDNPHQDIPLVGVLASPIFGWSYDALARIRAGREGKDFFDALCDAAAEDTEAAQLLQTLNRLQTQQRLCRLTELLQLLDRELKLRSVLSAMENGKQRIRNLNTFYRMAASFEKDEPKTLHRFLSYLEELEEQEISTAAETTNAVQITSIHKSKGLEYPIVFLAGLSKHFNLQDAYETVLSHPKLGVACSVVDTENRVCYPSAAKQAIGLRLQRDTISEELRVLYVAMTRPKERLIMTYCTKQLKANLRRIALLLRSGTTQQAAQSATGSGDWVLLTAMGRMEGACLSSYAELSVEKTVSEIPWQISIDTPPISQAKTLSADAAEQETATLQLPEDLQHTLRFSYDHTAATTLPDKLTATQLKGRTLDEEAAEAGQSRAPRSLRFPRPTFSEQARPLSAAQRGTATHLAMQYISYAHCDSLAGIQAELDRLVRERFLTQEQAAAVSPQTLWAFFTSELGQQVLHAKNLVREFKFSVLVDAGILNPDAAGEKLMLQGVTDCCILEPDGFTVIDYKTDRVEAGAESRLAQYYRGQIEAYGEALSRVFGLPLKKRLLYFFATGTIHEV